MPAHQNIIAYGLNPSTGPGRVATCMTGPSKNHQDYVELLIIHSTSTPCGSTRNVCPQPIHLYRRAVTSSYSLSRTFFLTACQGRKCFPPHFASLHRCGSSNCSGITTGKINFRRICSDMPFFWISGTTDPSPRISFYTSLYHL